MSHVKAHVDTDDNERADDLTKKGAKLQFELMEKAAPDDWFQGSLHISTALTENMIENIYLTRS